MQVGIYSPRDGVSEGVARLVAEFDQSACLSLNVRLYREYSDLIADTARGPTDILFFDTEQCPDLKTRLKWVSQTLPTCSLALLGNDEKNAVFGYAVRAADYLTLPLDAEEFFSVLARLLRERVRLKTEFIPVRMHGIWQRINKDRVIFIHTDKHSLLFHMDDGKSLRVSGSFREYQPFLDVHSDYFRCHKSYVVNAKHVKKWDTSELTMDTGEIIAISRPYRQAARSFYSAYKTDSYQASAET